MPTTPDTPRTVWVLHESFGDYEPTALLGVYSTREKAVEAAATRTYRNGEPCPLSADDVLISDITLDDVYLTL